jgi:lysozyme
MLTGPDCSRHQGTINWSAVKAAGHDFAIIKATDGTSYRYIDWFRTNFLKVRAAGLVPGAYHFLNRADGTAQARYYVGEVNRAGGFQGVLAVVDVEKNADGTYPGISTVRAFVTEFRRLVPGHPLIVYTGRWFWVGYINNPYGADLGVLWHSEYESTQAEVDDGPESDNYGGWPRATFWQWTSSGRCPGVSGNCDLNIFYGDRAALAVLAGSTPDLEDIMTPAQMTEIKAHVNVQLVRVASWLTTGKVNALMNPNDAATAFADDPGTVTLNEVFGVDEPEIIAGVLAGLDPAAIAAAIPADIAEQVADELASRLAES